MIKMEIDKYILYSHRQVIWAVLWGAIDLSPSCFDSFCIFFRIGHFYFPVSSMQIMAPTGMSLILQPSSDEPASLTVLSGVHHILH